MRCDTVASTQDIARDNLAELPLLVMARGQTKGRGRGGGEWLNAERALAASLAIRRDLEDSRPFSLMAGVAAVRAVGGASLKWPNDVLMDGEKVGGILVERRDDVVVIGLGINLWWPSPPAGMAGIDEDDPGEERYAEVGGLWGAELMRLVDDDGWPRGAYREMCVTVGKAVTWEPGGSGHAVGVGADGGLIVDTERGRETIYSGAVRLVRADPKA